MPVNAAAGDQRGPLERALGAPEELAVSASFRARHETIDGQFRPGLAEKSDVLLLQADILASYDAGPVRFVGEVMDSRAYDADTDSPVGTSEVNALAVVQAHLALQLGDALGRGTRADLDVGRFTMDLGSRRLSARNGFRNTTNAFTGLRGRFQSRSGVSATVFYTLPVVRLPTESGRILDNDVAADRQAFDLTFWGGIASAVVVPGAPTVEGYVFGLDESDGETPTRDRHLITAGARVLRGPAKGKLDYEVEGAWQTGSVRASTDASAARMDVAAWFFHASLGYRFDTPWSPRVAIAFDQASGDGSGTKYGRFDTLFGSRRWEFGPTSTFGALGRANLISPEARIEAKPGSRLDLLAAYRAAWLDSPTDAFASTGVRDPEGGSGRFAGHQIETRVRYRLVPGLLDIEAGGAILIRGRFLQDAPNANGFGDTRFAYVSTTLSL